jgi:hypothetical protein
MKKYLLLPVVGILFMGCKTKNTVGANGVTYKNALEYNEYIISRQIQLQKDITEYTADAQISIDEADKGLDKMISDASVSLKDIEGMPPYNGDSTFRNAAIALFSFYKTRFGNDFKDMHQLKRKLENGTATDDDQQKLDKFSDNISAKEGPLDAKFKETQTKFAKDNNLTIIENNEQK